jgi:hypothetical protein
METQEMERRQERRWLLCCLCGTENPQDASLQLMTQALPGWALGDLSAFQIPKPLLHTTGLRCTTLRDHAETILETASVEAW